MGRALGAVRAFTAEKGKGEPPARLLGPGRVPGGGEPRLQQCLPRRAANKGPLLPIPAVFSPASTPLE